MEISTKFQPNGNGLNDLVKNIPNLEQISQQQGCCYGDDVGNHNSV